MKNEDNDGGRVSSDVQNCYTWNHVTSNPVFNAWSESERLAYDLPGKHMFGFSSLKTLWILKM